MPANSFASIIKSKQKEWDCPELMTRATADVGKKLPFSSPLLNWCTYGGIPRDAYTEFFGAPGGGKSTTSIDICKNAIDVFRKEYEDKMQEYRDKVASGKKEYQGPMEELEELGPKKLLYVDLENLQTRLRTLSELTGQQSEGLPIADLDGLGLIIGDYAEALDAVIEHFRDMRSAGRVSA